MGVKVAVTSLHWSQPTLFHTPSSSQTLASAKRRSCTADKALVCRLVHKVAFFGAQSSKFRTSMVKRGIRGSLDSYSDNEFPKKLFDPLQPPEWLDRKDQMIPASFERQANSVELPFSLRIIKKKKQWQQGVTVAGESAYCSVKKAFSSMVFIIRELQSYTLQMREALYYENLQGILERVQMEMNASFVWLFQQVFSHTPTLMVYVMILLANYSVQSMSVSMAATSPPITYTSTIDSTIEDQSQGKQFDSSIIKSFPLTSSGQSTSINGGNGGIGNYRPSASGTDGDGKSDGFGSMTIVPEGISSSSIANPRTSKDESVSGQVNIHEELNLWNSIVDQAKKLQAEIKDESLDLETTQRFVSPVKAKMEGDDYSDYSRTELLYQIALSQTPNNPLLLANFAQFILLVAHDYDRAEEYFKKAVAEEPKDAEALNKYAIFLWKIRKDLWAAEETYLEAISADPENSYYAANYAHFLWNTGAEDTCFPLDSEVDTQI